jgi:hypothetical protein
MRQRPKPNRAAPGCMLLIGLFLFAGFRANAEAPFGVRLCQAVAQTGQAVSVDVAVLNPGQKWPGILIDRLSSPYPPTRRPGSVVTFTILDKRGRPLLLHEDESVCGVPELLTPSDLLILHPGELFGWRIDLGDSTYPYHLAAGQYRIRAKVCISFGSFVAEETGFRTFLQSLYGPLDSKEAPILTEGCSESEPIVVTMPVREKALVH